jgi:hypothetical protein
MFYPLSTCYCGANCDWLAGKTLLAEKPRLKTRRQSFVQQRKVFEYSWQNPNRQPWARFTAPKAVGPLRQNLPVF